MYTGQTQPHASQWDCPSSVSDAEKSGGEGSVASHGGRQKLATTAKALAKGKD